MGKPLPDGRLDTGPDPKKPDQEISEQPPQIPPRMKKTKGPELPEKPAHIRAKSNLLSSQQLQLPLPREPLKPRILNMEKSPCREVLVAACKAGRERPVDKRQREPPKLLKPTGGSTYRRDILVPPGHLEEAWRDATTPRGPVWRSDEYLAMPSLSSPLWPLNEQLVHGRSHKSSSRKPNCPVHQPLLVVPRHLIEWGSTPVSHALWTPQRDVGRASEKPAKHHHQHQFKSGTSGTSRPGVRSGSVTRSGSLTSQGSSGSESGCEASFPISVLKKQKRVSVVAPKEVTSQRRMDQKKIVTFNAFATVQVVED